MNTTVALPKIYKSYLTAEKEAIRIRDFHQRETTITRTSAGWVVSFR